MRQPLRNPSPPPFVDWAELARGAVALGLMLALWFAVWVALP